MLFLVVAITEMRIVSMECEKESGLKSVIIVNSRGILLW